MKAQKANSSRLDIIGNGHARDQEIFSSTLRRWRQRVGYCSIFAAIPAMLVSNLPAARSAEADAPSATVPRRRSSRLLERFDSTPGRQALLKRQSEFRLPHQSGSFDVTAALAGVDDCPGLAIPGGNYTAAAPFTASGDTTGANDTVKRFTYYYYYTFDTSGPDHVYSFTLTGLGPNPQIKVSTTSGSYKPLVYVLRGGAAGACPTGTGNTVANVLVSAGFASNSATISSQQMNFLPLNVPLHLFVDSFSNDASGSGPYTIRMQDVTIAPSTVSSNPIDSPEFFVRQHYADFLNRDPDAGGLAYWTNRITECGTNQQCVHDRRIDVSAAFFVAQEFQETGFYVYRIYKASLGRPPNYAEFNADRSKVIGGDNLETLKQAFADEWVQRTAFLNAYSTTLSNTEFVNKLFDTAGLTAPAYDPLRQQEIQAMNSGRSRALILRDVIEFPDFYNREYNPAFVRVQYFGYLRRDTDAGGEAFWLDVLNNRLPGNYRSMVCAFLTSEEYQRRFGASITRSNQDCTP